MLATFSEARSKTLSSEGLSQWGVHLSGDAIALFKGVTYNPADAATRVRGLPSTVLLTWNVGGGSDVVFDRLTGATSQPGTLALTLYGASESKVINILASGITY